MKKALLFGLTLVLAISAWAMFPADPACALGNCMPGGSTIPQWGMGATCAEANQDAINLAWNLVPGDCDVCSFREIEVSPCHDCPNDPGVKCADWRVQYRCASEFIDPPM